MQLQINKVYWPLHQNTKLKHFLYAFCKRRGGLCIVEWHEFKYRHVFCRQKWNGQSSDLRRDCWASAYHVLQVASRSLGQLQGKREDPPHPKFSADSQLLRCWCLGCEHAALPMVRSALTSVFCGQAQMGSKCQKAPPAAGTDAQLLFWGTGLLSIHLHWARSSGQLPFSTKLKLLFYQIAVLTRCC